MKYDRDGFPIPPRFEAPAVDDAPASPWSGEADRRRTTSSGFEWAAERTGSPSKPRTSSASKQSLIALVLVLGVVPTLVGPWLMATIRPLVVEWSWERSLEFEGNDDIEAALVEIDRAIAWHDQDDQQLLCRRAWLRLHGGDADGAVEDTRRAEAVNPMAAAPLRVRGLAEIVRGNTADAIQAGQVVRDRGRRDPISLNHLAYLRALANRDLPEALSDIDEAIELESPDASADILDTRGFVLHLLGRDDEALEQMEEAIAKQLAERHKTRLAAGRGGISPVAVRLRLREIEHGLAVMHHHRGLIHRATGRGELAERDFETARVKGFDPARGVM